jgi:carbon storage regulator
VPLSAGGYILERKQQLESTRRTAEEANGILGWCFDPISSWRAAEMLVLSRKLGESIVIGGGITITVIRIKGSVVQLGIDAPIEIPVHRSELQERDRLLATLQGGAW